MPFHFRSFTYIRQDRVDRLFFVCMEAAIVGMLDFILRCDVLYSCLYCISNACTLTNAIPLSTLESMMKYDQIEKKIDVCLQLVLLVICSQFITSKSGLVCAQLKLHRLFWKTI